MSRARPDNTTGAADERQASHYVVTVIHPTGMVEEVVIERAKEIEQLQSIVGGWIQLIHVPYEGKVRTAFVNEEGKMHGLPYNARATEMYRRDVLVGSLIICTQGEPT